ncbi:MAG: PfkB family carbohydrate kinase [Vicinamibacteria bacterium]|jgi:sugar/nucleoside kinase (ribokinase family)|nr:PfkB family carbohydrate kinase [Vicinamibacteria bacterium]
MPRLLVVGHITLDRLQGVTAWGGTATYAALCAQRLGWEAAILTSTGPEFDPVRDLPGIHVFTRPARLTTRFVNTYDENGERRQVVSARAEDIDLAVLPESWRCPDVLLLGPLVGEIEGALATVFEADVVGAMAQGWLRAVDRDGHVAYQPWENPGASLSGVHALILSEKDMPEGEARADLFLRYVPIVAITRGWQGLSLHTRETATLVPTLPREEIDPTGAGDVFATGFLIRYQETGDLSEAAGFGALAASCVVEGPGASALGDRAELARRAEKLEQLLANGEWDD